MSTRTTTKSKREPVRIRGYRTKDLENCRNLWVQLTEWHRQLYDDPSIGGMNPSRKFDQHLHRVGRNNVWVAEKNGNVIGMTGLIPGKSEAELEPVVVDESHRGSDVGKRLVETAIDAARKRGFHIVTTKPVARNREAIRFFHVQGFRVLGQLELLNFLTPRRSKRWKPGETIAGEKFLV